MSTTSCPRCSGQVTLPVGAGNNAQVRCPLCGERYSLADALVNMPPLLEVVEAGDSDNWGDEPADVQAAMPVTPSPVDDITDPDGGTLEFAAPEAPDDLTGTEQDRDTEVEDLAPLAAMPGEESADESEAADLDFGEPVEALPADAEGSAEDDEMGLDFGEPAAEEASEAETLAFTDPQDAEEEISFDADDPLAAGASEAPTIEFGEADAAADDDDVQFNFDDDTSGGNAETIEFGATDEDAPQDLSFDLESASDPPSDEGGLREFEDLHVDASGEAEDIPMEPVMAPVAAVEDAGEEDDGKKKKKGRKKKEKKPKAAGGKRSLVGTLVAVGLPSIIAVVLVLYGAAWISPDYDFGLTAFLPEFMRPNHGSSQQYVAGRPTTPPPSLGTMPESDPQTDPTQPDPGQPDPNQPDASQPENPDAGMTEPDPSAEAPVDEASPTEPSGDAAPTDSPADTEPAADAPADDPFAATPAPAEEMPSGAPPEPAGADPFADQPEEMAADAPAGDDPFASPAEPSDDPFASPAPAEESVADARAADEPVAAPGEAMPAGDDPFASPETPAEAPAADATAADDPFGSPEVPAESPAGDDPFGTPAPEEAPPADDPFATPAAPAETPAADDPFGTPAVEEAPPAEDPFGAPAEEAMPADDPFATPAPAEEPAAAPAADDPFAPVEPLPAPEEPAEEPVGPRAVAQLSPAEVMGAVQATMTANQQLAAAEQSGDEAALRKAKTNFYVSLFGMADAVTQAKLGEGGAAMGPQLEMLGPAIKQQLAADPQKLESLKVFGGRWFAYPKKPNNGAALVGTVQESQEVGKLFQTKLKLGDAPDALVVTVVSDEDPKLAPGDDVLALGSIIEKPAEEVAGYQGSDPAVVWSGLTMKLSH